jgi:citrate lyase subunit beta/citryl-CoA lyase
MNPTAARSWLFVPGNRSDRFAKAASCGADVVVCDLEDAVAAHAKQAAREAVARWLSHGGRACVRINAIGTPDHDADVSALSGVSGLTAVMVPKAQDPRAMAELSAGLSPGTSIVPLVETAVGVHRAYDVATVPGVSRLAFGSIDFALDVGAEDSATPLLFARSTLVVASRAAGLDPPVDGVTVDLEAPDAAAGDARAAARLGFGGKLCVHPSQVGPVNNAFRPSEDEVRHARRVLASVREGGVGRLDGQMVDRPVVERAERVLQRAGLDHLPDDSRRS